MDTTSTTTTTPTPAPTSGGERSHTTLHSEFDKAESERRGALFEDLAFDNSFTEMESLCMNCEQTTAVTRILLIKIPFFKEVILMATTCSQCGWRSNEVQYGGSIAEKGCKIEFSVQNVKDSNRQIVKADTASLLIPELEFEVPPNTQKGLINTIEGFLSQSVTGLKEGQEGRRNDNPEVAAKIDVFIEKLEKCATGEIPFTIVVDDPAGNSFIENPFAPQEDPNMKVTHYKRTPEQNFKIGLTSEDTPEDIAYRQYLEQRNSGQQKESSKNVDLDLEKFDYKNEVMTFPTDCYACHAPSQTRMVVVDIPFFKEVVIMAMTCDQCGYKTNEVKGGGAIPPKAKRITLKITNPDDLSRNVLKSETGIVVIPELQIQVGRGSLGGRFTTIEGLLIGIKDDISTNQFLSGDSSEEQTKEKAKNFVARMDKLIAGEENFTLIMEDPVANSYIQNIYAPDDDPNMSIEEFDRTFEQNEDLGLNDIRTENYEDDEVKS